jgi:hypothetical protein
MHRLFITLLCVAIPWHAHANCANDSAQIKLALPPESLAIRKALRALLGRRPVQAKPDTSSQIAAH